MRREVTPFAGASRGRKRAHRGSERTSQSQKSGLEDDSQVLGEGFDVRRGGVFGPRGIDPQETVAHDASQKMEVHVRHFLSCCLTV